LIKFSNSHLFELIFAVKFCPLYKNLEEAFQSRHTRSIGMGKTIPNRHICSVGTGATVPNRHIRSPNRQSIWPKRFIPEQTHPFGRNGRNRSE